MKLFSLALNESNSEYMTNIKKDSRERLRSRQQAWASSYSRDRRGARIVPPQTGGEGQKRGPHIVLHVARNEVLVRVHVDRNQNEGLLE